MVKPPTWRALTHPVVTPPPFPLDSRSSAYFCAPVCSGSPCFFSQVLSRVEFQSKPPGRAKGFLPIIFLYICRECQWRTVSWFILSIIANLKMNPKYDGSSKCVFYFCNHKITITMPNELKNICLRFLEPLLFPPLPTIFHKKLPLQWIPMFSEISRNQIHSFSSSNQIQRNDISPPPTYATRFQAIVDLRIIGRQNKVARSFQQNLFAQRFICQTCSPTESVLAEMAPIPTYLTSIPTVFPAHSTLLVNPSLPPQL